MTKSVAIGYNTCRYAYRFRGNLIKALVSDGYRVFVLAPRDSYANKIEMLGAEVLHVPISHSMNPLSNLNTLCAFYSALRNARPDVYLGFTIKPNTIGALAAKALGVPFIASIAGLGHSFSERNLTMAIAKALYRLTLRSARYVFLQNSEDFNELVSGNIVRQEQVIRIPGSGVDSEYFSYSPKSIAKDAPFVFLFLSRLLWSKGLKQYVDAAQVVRMTNRNVRFLVMGHLEANRSKDCVSDSDLRALKEQGVIEVMDGVDDVRAVIQYSDCVVLPSYYREGVPRVLLEAAAIGRPIITTDSVGCRDAVLPEISGFLVQPKDPQSLSEAMLRMLHLEGTKWQEMSMAGRKFIEDNFMEQYVVNRYRDCIDRA